MLLTQNREQSTRVYEAINDLHVRTLGGIASSLERLIYIASTRDYNSSCYHHAGLEARFGVTEAIEALAHVHREVFEDLALMPLSALTDELRQYIEKSRELPAVFLNSWQKLEPFRVAIPLNADPFLAELFISNVKLALAVVRFRLRSSNPSVSLPMQSPAPRSRLQFHC